MNDKKSPAEYDEYPHLARLSTRWMDNDVYGHVNNVIYYSWFDTVVNQYLVEKAVLDPVEGEVVGLVVETQCNYFAPVSFPDSISAGLRVAHIGNSSVRYEVGIFRNDDRQAAAQGHFIHVYVDRQSRRPVPLPDDLISVLKELVLQG